MQGHLSQERRYATPPFQGQQVPDRRRQVAHRGIQANAPGRIALRARFSAIRHVPSIYERYHEWDIEDSFETTKNELGLDHNETRSWRGWRRHVTLVMLAFALMASIRVHANAVSPPPKRMRRQTKTTRLCNPENL